MVVWRHVWPQAYAFSFDTRVEFVEVATLVVRRRTDGSENQTNLIKTRNMFKKIDIHGDIYHTNDGIKKLYPLWMGEYPKNRHFTERWESLWPENKWTNQMHPKTCKGMVKTCLWIDTISIGDLLCNTLEAMRLIR